MSPTVVAGTTLGEESDLIVETAAQLARAMGATLTWHAAAGPSTTWPPISAPPRSRPRPSGRRRRARRWRRSPPACASRRTSGWPCTSNPARPIVPSPRWHARRRPTSWSWAPPIPGQRASSARPRAAWSAWRASPSSSCAAASRSRRAGSSCRSTSRRSRPRWLPSPCSTSGPPPPHPRTPAAPLAQATTPAVAIEVLHVVPPPDRPEPEPPPATAGESPAAAECHARLGALLRAAGSDAWAIASRLRTGRPAAEIQAEIAAAAPDLVILGTHSRRGLQRLFLGSVAATTNCLLVPPRSALAARTAVRTAAAHTGQEAAIRPSRRRLLAAPGSLARPLDPGAF